METWLIVLLVVVLLGRGGLGLLSLALIALRWPLVLRRRKEA